MKRLFSLLVSAVLLSSLALAPAVAMESGKGGDMQKSGGMQSGDMKDDMKSGDMGKGDRKQGAGMTPGGDMGKDDMKKDDTTKKEDGMGKM